MRNKLRRILDLILDLNAQGATKTTFSIAAHVNEIDIWVWEGEEFKEENTLYHERAYYAGQLRDEAKVDEIIRSLEELRKDI